LERAVAISAICIRAVSVAVIGERAAIMETYHSRRAWWIKAFAVC
jgi:hypothetical protein